MELPLQHTTPYRVYVYDPSDADWFGLRNWSLRILHPDNDPKEQRRYITELASLLHKHGIRRAYAPEVSTASAIIDTAAAKRATKITARPTPVTIYRRFDSPVDGVFIKPDEAVILSTAGCPVIVAHAHGHMVVAHAARDSLIERATLYGTPERAHFSVVHAILDAFESKGVPACDVYMHMMLALSHKHFFHSFAHNVHGEYNRALAAYLDDCMPENDRDCMLFEDGVALSLESVFKAQAEQAGVRQARVAHQLSDFPRLVQTAATPERNLVIIQRLQ